MDIQELKQQLESFDVVIQVYEKEIDEKQQYLDQNPEMPHAELLAGQLRSLNITIDELRNTRASIEYVINEEEFMQSDEVQS